MWHVGIDLHRVTVVIAAVNDAGEAMDPITIRCEDTEAIRRSRQEARRFSRGDRSERHVSLALRSAPPVRHGPPGPSAAPAGHDTTPQKTDKLDAQLLANLLRINQIPLAYIPPEPYQQLRELTRCRLGSGRIRRRRRSNCGRSWPGRIGRRRTACPSASRPGLVPQAGLRADREPGPRRAAGTAGALPPAIGDPRSHVVDLREAFPQVGGPDGRSTALGCYSALLIVARTGRGRTFSHGQASRRLCRVDLARPPVRRPLLPRLDHAAGFALAAVDPGRGGDEGDPRRSGLEELLHAGAEAVQREDRAGRDRTQAGGNMLETAAAVAWRTCRRSRLRQGCIAHQYGRRWPGKGTGGASHRSDDWALRPVNKILCDERQFGRHEWVTTMCALRQTMERRKRMERTTRRRHPCQHISANPFADQGCHCRPLAPRLASLRSGVVMILENPKIRALTRGRLWVSPFHLCPRFTSRTDENQ